MTIGGGTIQNVERLFFFSDRKLDFDKTLVSLYIARIERDGAIGIIDSLIHFLEILRIDEGQLAVGLGIVRICLDRIL